MNKPIEANFFDQQHILDPFPFYEGILGSDIPIAKLPGTETYIIFSAALVREVCRRTSDFSSDLSKDLIGKRADDPDVRAVSEQGWPFTSTLMTADPPLHGRSRKFAMAALSKKKIDSIAPEIRSLVTGLIDGFIDKGQCDFVEEFAVPLPVNVIRNQIGLGHVPARRIKMWSDAVADRAAGMIDKEREIECARLIVEFQHCMYDEICRRRTSRENDILQFLLDASAEEEEPVSEEEMLSVLQQLMVGGHETTTSSLAGGMLLLCENPEIFDRAQRDSSMMAGLIEETLRLVTAAQGVWRKVKSDTELGGIAIPAGAMIMCRLGSANRDPSIFEDPAQFCPHRSGLNRHVAFGSGIHVCVGHFLARAELAIAFTELLTRLRNVRLANGFQPPYGYNTMIRNLTKLSILFEKM